ncbi:DedA family protein [Clostridium sp.]|uniref:DedA family protein n=1 Tax=Clostridium sp. TaxID=1506 RepID=UPI003A19069B
MDSIINLFHDYGYIILTISLMLELIALPLPGQTIMTYCGYIIGVENMSWSIGILMASIGGIIGITISYFIGKALGRPFFERYGKFIYLDKKNLKKISIFFAKYGVFMLFIAYFIPGVRHISGYFSGIIKIPLKKFMLCSYIGAFIWTSTFISFGKFLGNNFNLHNLFFTKYTLIAVIAVIVCLILFYYIKKRLNGSFH